MALIVQKYGGTSVGTIEKIENVADKVIASKLAALGYRTRGKKQSDRLIVRRR